MKVIIPVLDNEAAKNELAPDFSATDHVCIYDCENESLTWVSTTAISRNGGNLSLELKRKGIHSVISSQMPLMVLGLFVESGLKVYKAQGTDLFENIKLFQKNFLQSFTSSMSMELSSCAGSCSSCGTICN